MADRWMDDRDRQWRDRDWDRGERFGRGRESAWDEQRSWPGGRDDDDAYRARRSGSDRDRVFGERETGQDYTRSAYGSGRFDDPGPYPTRPYHRQTPPSQPQDYTRGGGGYGEDAGMSRGREPYASQGRGFDQAFYAQDMRQRASGGTGGYDYERGYGDAGRRDRDRADRGGAGDFLHRAGERISAWMGGGASAEDRGHRGRGPKGYRRTDERISEEAHERLTEDPWLDASTIEVSVSGGEVTLSGTVENRAAKHRAEQVVEDISGVNHVQNNLRVGGNPITGSGTGFGDSANEAQIRKAEDPKR